MSLSFFPAACSPDTFYPIGAPRHINLRKEHKALLGSRLHNGWFKVDMQVCPSLGDKDWQLGTRQGKILARMIVYASNP